MELTPQYRLYGDPRGRYNMPYRVRPHIDMTSGIEKMIKEHGANMEKRREAFKKSPILGTKMGRKIYKRSSLGKGSGKGSGY